MIYASVELYESRILQRDPLQCTGAQEAQDKCLDAILTTGQIAEAHIFSDTPDLPYGTIDLQRHFAEGRISWKHLALLPQLSEHHEYVCVTSAAAFAAVSGIRGALGRVAFPICGHAHSLMGSDILGQLSLCALRAAPCDVFLTSNPAVCRAVRAAVESAIDWLRDRGVSGATLRIEELPIPVDVEIFRPREKLYCRDALGLPNEKLIILVPKAVLRRRKEDPEPLLAILKEVALSFPEVMLVIAGQHIGATCDVEAQARELGVAGRIRLISDLAPHVKPLLYAAADIFAYPDDSIQQASDLSLLEAMSTGLPTIASDWISAKGEIDDGVNGLLVPTYWNPIAAAMMSWLSVGAWPQHFLADRTVMDIRRLRDGIDALLRRAEFRSELGSNARKHIEMKHSPDTVAKRAVNVWSRQLAELKSVTSDVRTSGLDFTAVFKDSATLELDLALAIRVSDLGRPLLGDELRGPATHSVSKMIRPEVNRLLDLTHRHPVTIKECIESGSEFTFEAIVWLLKAGYFEPANAPIESLPTPAQLSI